MFPLFAHGEAVIAVSFYNWYLDPTAILVLFVALFYKLGLRIYRNKPRFQELKWRQWFFWTGFVVLILALCSPLDTYADSSFSMHMIQHLLIIMVSVPFILLGAPYLPLVKGAPVIVRKTIVAPLIRSSVLRGSFLFLLHPVNSLIFFTLMLWIWHYPPLYDLALRNEYWHLFEHFCFFYSSIFLWWNIVTPYPLSSKLSPPLKMVLILGAVIQNSILSAIITFQSKLIYAFSNTVNPFSLDHHTDQILGGLIMWVPGSMMYVIALGACFASMVNQQKTNHSP